MRRRLVGVTSGALCVALLLVAALPARAEDARAELFDPLIGSWELQTWFAGEDGERVERTAELVVRRLESDQAPIVQFEERHRNAAGGVFISRVQYAYHAESDSWRGTGINTLANRKWRDVIAADDAIVLLERGELFGGRDGVNRITYFNLAADSFDCRVEQSSDGTTWASPGYGFHAVRTDAVSEPAGGDAVPVRRAETGDAERVARDYMAAYSAADFERMGAMMAEDIEFADPTNPADDGGLETQGREATMAMLHAFDEQFHPIGLNFAWDTVFESHDRVVFMGHVNATYPTDQPGQVFRWRAAQVTVITVRDGRVTRHQDFADYEHAEQGLVPAD